jgi:hypothetical protein
MDVIKLGILMFRGEIEFSYVRTAALSVQPHLPGSSPDISRKQSSGEVWHLKS